MRSIAALSAALALSACATLPAIRGDGLARRGEATRVGALVVTPRAGIEDSRCPVDVRCVWAGRAIVRTQVEGAGWRETLDLTLGERVATHGTTLGLTSIEPGKVAGSGAAPLDYRFGFEGGR